MTPYSEMLRRMLDSTGWKRAEWATILNRSESDIESWVNDKGYPSPETLRRIVRTLEEDITVPDSLLEEFEMLASLPLEESLDLNTLLREVKVPSTTIAHFMGQTIRAAFLRTMDTISPYAQEIVFLKAAELARQHRSLRKPTVKERRDEFRRVIPDSFSYCCSRMAESVSSKCTQHEDRHACPDALLGRHSDGTHGILIHDGGSSMIEIEFCPFCGKNLR